MSFDNKRIIDYLKTFIDNTILPIITSDYVLWGLPYYVNPGDTFIWEGTLELLKKCPYRCIGTCGWNEYRHVKLDKGTTILIMGGGYFGDVWRKAWQQVIDTITYYPENPIIILPQSIYYHDYFVAQQDKERLSSCRRLTILVRDQESFVFSANTFTSAKTILCPDLAFHMDVEKLMRYASRESKNNLYLKRNDSEFVAGRNEDFAKNAVISDWPDMTGKMSFRLRCVYFIDRILRQSRTAPSTIRLSSFLMKYLQRRIVLRDAVIFISQFKTIYTTRLHAMILSFLLGKNVVIIDNSYGKVSGCFRTWLQESDNISIYGEKTSCC